MSRVILDRLCQQIVLRGLKSFEPQPLPAFALTDRRHKATRVTTVRDAGAPPIRPHDWSHSVTGTTGSPPPLGTSAKQSASACPLHNTEPRRSAHVGVAEAESIMGALTNKPTTASSYTEIKDSTSDENRATGSAIPWSNMPGPFSLPVIGTLWMHAPGGPLYGMTYEEKTKRMRELYGPLFREDVLLGFSMLHVYRPEDMEAVYRAQGMKPRREAFRMLKIFNEKFRDGVQGLLTSQGDEWHRLRTKAQAKMMKPKSASAYLELHNLVSQDFVTLIDRVKDEDGVIDDLLPHLYKFAMEGIGCVCFNRRLGALAQNIPADSDTYRFIEAVNDVMVASHSELTSFFLHTRSPMFKKLNRAQTFIRKLSLQEATRSLEMFSQSQKEVLDGESGDLIPYLMTKTDLTEAEVMTIVSEFFFGGVDTTSHLLGFALYCLSKNPEAQEKLVQEIDKFIPDKDCVISANTLGRMSYLKAVTKETFRVMPIAPGNGRTLDTDIVLDGYRIPAGTLIGLHHDWAGKSPEYVLDPHVFMPERWSRGNTSPHADIHPFVLMPFGFGPRSCIGRRFAEQEYSLALIKILQKYHVEFCDPRELKYEMCIINKPLHPLKFRFVSRT